jgi:hypothetical protein
MSVSFLFTEMHCPTVAQGRLSPTSSHLFKLVLPLSENLFTLTKEEKDDTQPLTPPTVFLLHPSQPLSHISRLIAASISATNPTISFHSSLLPDQTMKRPEKNLDSLTESKQDTHVLSSTTKCYSATPDELTAAHVTPPQGGGREDGVVPCREDSMYSTGSRTPNPGSAIGVQWSESTDIGDFVKESARDTEFLIVLEAKSHQGKSNAINLESQTPRSENTDRAHLDPFIIYVTVPTFAVRTRFLRQRLARLSGQVGKVSEIKRICDNEAHKGARRLAMAPS